MMDTAISSRTATAATLTELSMSDLPECYLKLAAQLQPAAGDRLGVDEPALHRVGAQDPIERQRDLVTYAERVLVALGGTARVVPHDAYGGGLEHQLLV